MFCKRYCGNPFLLSKRAIWILIYVIIIIIATGVYKYQRFIYIDGYYNMYANSNSKQKRNYHVHNFEDTAYSRFEVAKTKLHFLPGFKNPCILNRLSVKKPFVYSKNKFLTENYSKMHKLMRKLGKFANRMHYGLIINIKNNTNVKPGKYRARCLPYFLLLGVAKSGTADFYSRAKAHPDIYVAINKELYFWSQFRFQINSTIGDYMDLFDKALLWAMEKFYREEQTELVSNFVLSEYTSTEFTDNVFWRSHPLNKGLMEPKYLNAHDIYTVNPETKLIVLLRNPTARLYSSYNKFRRTSPEDFHSRVVSSIEWWRNCTEVLGLPRRRCVYGCPPEMPPVVVVLTDKEQNNRWPGDFGKYSGEIRRGMYAIFAKDWLSVFPKEQILFLRTEDNGNMLKTFNEKVFPFLGLKQVTKGPQRRKLASKKHKHRSKSHEPMLEKTKILLDTFYAPFNKELANLLGDDKWLWKD